MSADEKPTPKLPAAHIYRNKAGEARLIPAPEAFNIPEETLARYQSDALELVDDLRDRILAGEIIGFGYATITPSEGDLAVSRAWSSGFIAYGLHGVSAIKYLDVTFNREFFT